MWSSEIDEFPAGVTAHWFPTTKQLGDITKIKVEDLEPVDIICAGSPCFAGKTLVKTTKGLICIKDINVGDLLVMRDEEYKCRNKWNRGVKKVIKVTFADGSSVVCTPNHKFLCDNEWVVAQNLLGKTVDTDDGKGIMVTSLCISDDEIVYDIEVECIHRFALANGAIVKNCQDLSVAGKREGLDGERSGLFRTAIELVHGLRLRTNGEYPRFFVWENVPGAFSSNKGLDFKAVLEEITETDIPMPAGDRWAESGMVECGRVRVEWTVLNAAEMGVPQRRKRIFLIADFAATERGRGTLLPLTESLRWDIAESGSEGQSSAGETGTSAEGAGRTHSLLGNSYKDNPLTTEDGRSV